MHSRLIRIDGAPDGTCREAIALAHMVLTSIDALAATSEEACAEPILIPPVGTSKPPVTSIGDEEVEGQWGRDGAVTRGGIHPDAQRLELMPEDEARLRTEGVGCVDITEGDALTRVVDIDTSRPVAIAAEEAEASLCDGGPSRHTEGLFLGRPCWEVGEVGLIDGREGCHIEGQATIDTEGHLVRLTETQGDTRLGSCLCGREEEATRYDDRSDKRVVLSSIRRCH